MKLNIVTQLAIVALPLVGCSFGGVTDKDTGAWLGDANIRIEKISTDRSGTIKFTGRKDAKTWGDASEAGGTWYLNPYAELNAGDTTKTYVPPGWSRYLVSKTGYDTRSFVRNHLYAPCKASTANPYSAGPYPFVPYGSQQSTDGVCSQQDFELRQSTTNYIKDPDLVVDPRWLSDWSYRTVRSDCDGAANQCVRVSVATANIGVGDLEVWAPEGQEDVVSQTRYNRITGKTDTRLSARFVSDGHPHLHLDNWTQIRLRRIDSTCNSEVTADRCPVLPVTGRKVSFCLMDFFRFDSSTDPSVYQSNGQHTCTVLNGRVVQGISAGSADLYDKSLSGQYVPTEGLHGNFWLEVEVNPMDEQGRRTVIESDYDNNIARVRIAIP